MSVEAFLVIVGERSGQRSAAARPASCDAGRAQTRQSRKGRGRRHHARRVRECPRPPARAVETPVLSAAIPRAVGACRSGTGRPRVTNSSTSATDQHHGDHRPRLPVRVRPVRARSPRTRPAPTRRTSAARPGAGCGRARSSRWCRCCLSATNHHLPAYVRRTKASTRSRKGRARIASGRTSGSTVGSRPPVPSCELGGVDLAGQADRRGGQQQTRAASRRSPP